MFRWKMEELIVAAINADTQAQHLSYGRKRDMMILPILSSRQTAERSRLKSNQDKCKQVELTAVNIIRSTSLKFISL